MDKYYLSVTFGGEKIEREVSLEEFCKAERAAGFYPKRTSISDINYLTTPATGGFSGTGVSGIVRYLDDKPQAVTDWYSKWATTFS